jgi:AraC-like DNA-binding protein
MQPNTVFHFSTDDVPVRERLAMWREVVGRQYMRLDLEPEGSSTLRARLEVHYLSSTLITFLQTTPMKYTRTLRDARSGDGNFTLVFGAREKFHFHADGYHESFGDGEAALLFNGRGGTIHVPHRRQFTTVQIDGDRLRTLVRTLDESPIHCLRGGNAALRLLEHYVNGIVPSEPFDPALDRLVNAHIIDLLALNLRPTEETIDRAGRGAMRAARLAAVRADVMANFSQVRLSAKTIARRQGVSERYVYLLFEESGLSFSRVVTEVRLQHAIAMLLDPACAAMRISDISLAVGFGDLTTFNRAFRRHFGDTPRAIRRGQQPGVP